MVTDNGLAALAASLHLEECGDTGTFSHVLHVPKAAAILGPRGVFLADGLDGLIPWTCIYCEGTWPRDEPITVLQDHIRVCDKHPFRAADATIATLRAELENAEWYTALRERDEEIATLRAALDGLVEAAREVVIQRGRYYRDGVEDPALSVVPRISLRRLDVASVTAKEAGG